MKLFNKLIRTEPNTIAPAPLMAGTQNNAKQALRFLANVTARERLMAHISLPRYHLITANPRRTSKTHVFMQRPRRTLFRKSSEPPYNALS